MRYWNEGENQSFLLLLNQIDRREIGGEQSGDYGSDFSESFPNRAKRLWAEISSPFLKVQDDMEDFLADDDDEDEDDNHIPINPHFTPPTKEGEKMKSPEEEMVEFLQRKNSQRGAASSSDNDESSSANYSSEELEVLSRQGADEEEEEEEDEWMKSKQLAAKKKAIKRAKRHEDSSDSDDPFAQETSMNGSRKSIGMDDSDDEKPLVGKSSSTRTRLAESSDEE